MEDDSFTQVCHVCFEANMRLRVLPCNSKHMLCEQCLKALPAGVCPFCKRAFEKSACTWAFFGPLSCEDCEAVVPADKAWWCPPCARFACSDCLFSDHNKCLEQRRPFRDLDAVRLVSPILRKEDSRAESAIQDLLLKVRNELYSTARQNSLSAKLGKAFPTVDLAQASAKSSIKEDRATRLAKNMLGAADQYTTSDCKDADLMRRLVKATPKEVLAALENSFGPSEQSLQTKNSKTKSNIYEKTNVTTPNQKLSPVTSALLTVGGLNSGRSALVEAVQLAGGPSRLNDLPKALTDSSATRLPDGRVFNTGGLDVSGTVRNLPTDVCAYIDPKTLGVYRAPKLPWAVSGHATALIGDTVFSVGGSRNKNWSSTADCAAFRDEAWIQVKPMHSPRRSHGLASDGTQLAAFGGIADRRELATVELYSPGADTWTRGPEIPRWNAKSNLRAVFMDGRFFVCGGSQIIEIFNNSEPIRRGETQTTQPRVKVHSQVMAWDPRSRPIWQNMDPMNIPRAGHGLAVLGNKLYAFGGLDDTEETPTTLFGAMLIDAASFVTGNIIASKIHNSVEVYDSAANCWRTIQDELVEPGCHFGFCAL